MEEKDSLLGQIHDSELNKDTNFGELQKARALNTDLDLKLKEVIQSADANNPKVLKEQKTLINDLKQRNNVLEKELNTVERSANRENAELRKQKDLLTQKIETLDQ